MSEEVRRNVKTHLDVIKRIYGVENIVLSQRDGSPIESAGIWLSSKEVFGVCSSAAAIFNVAEHLHKSSLNYILIDGVRAKILVAPIRNSDNSPLTYGGQIDTSLLGNYRNSETEYFIAITTRPKTNLGSIFLKMKKSLQSIRKILDESGLEFKPPLRSFSEEEVKNIFESFSVKEDDDTSSNISTFSLRVTAELSSRIRDLVFNYSKNVPGVKVACITLTGGYALCKFSIDPVIEAEGAISFSLFDTSKRIIYMLKKTPISSVLCDCANYSHFIYDLSGGVFSTFISRGEKRLGLLRMLIPQYVKQMTGYLKEADKIKEADEIPNEGEFDIKQILEELNI